MIMAAAVFVLLLQTSSLHVPLIAGGDARAIRAYVEELLHIEDTSGFRERYDGMYRPLGGDLGARLNELLPRHRFAVADLDDGDVHGKYEQGRVRLLLVIEAPTGRVVAHCWAPWFKEFHSQSFSDLLRQYAVRSKPHAIETVKALAAAIGATFNSSAETRAFFNDGEVVATLWVGDQPRYSVRVPLDDGGHFGRAVMPGETEELVPRSRWPQ